MIAKTAIVELLGRTPLFGSLDEGERRAVADEMREVNFEPSQVIFARGDTGREIYLVVSGRVRISVLTAEGRELSFAHAEAGSIFGEIAMLDGGPRSADATAVGKVSALSLSKPAFKRSNGMLFSRNRSSTATASRASRTARSRSPARRRTSARPARWSGVASRMLPSICSDAAATFNASRCRPSADKASARLTMSPRSAPPSDSARSMACRRSACRRS